MWVLCLLFFFPAQLFCCQNTKAPSLPGPPLLSWRLMLGACEMLADLALEVDAICGSNTSGVHAAGGSGSSLRKSNCYVPSGFGFTAAALLDHILDSLQMKRINLPPV